MPVVHRSGWTAKEGPEGAAAHAAKSCKCKARAPVPCPSRSPALTVGDHSVGSKARCCRPPRQEVREGARERPPSSEPKQERHTATFLPLTVRRSVRHGPMTAWQRRQKLLPPPSAGMAQGKEEERSVGPASCGEGANKTLTTHRQPHTPSPGK